MRSDVAALFREVADRSPIDREEYYRQQQVPDALRSEVESLLAYDVPGDSIRNYVASAERRFLDDTAAQSQDESRHSRGAPDRIGRFEVIELVGRGGMGEVYLARDPLIDRRVAIKLIGGEHEGDAERRRLVREARAAGRLHHPNIVTVFEAGEHDGRSFIAMEYVSGETLRSIIRRRAPLSLRQRLEMIEGACAGLAHAHHEGVIHLDIKPDNLMLADSGIVKVLDFGVSRVLHNETLATMHGAGTLRYMSPEQIQGSPLDHRSDVFSLGCSLFELVTYTPAFSGSTNEVVSRIAEGPIPNLSDVSPGIDERLDEIVGRAMALDPAERYDDLSELRAHLERVRGAIDPAKDQPDATSPLGVAQPGTSDGSAIAANSRRSSRRPTRDRGHERSRWPVTLAGGVGVAVLAGVVAFVAGGGFRNPPQPEGASTSPPVSTPVPAASTPAPVVEQTPTVAPGDDVWRQLARGDRTGVLARLGARDGSGDPALASAVIDTVKANVMRARQDAVSAGNRASAETYRAGEEQLARANRLAAGGQRVESLRAFWQAGDLYLRSLSTSAAPVTEASEPRVVTPSEPPIAPSTLPPPAVAVVEPPQPTPIPAPIPALASEPAVVTNPASPRTTPSDSDAIVDALRRYAAAYESLDVAAVLKVFPSLGNEQVEQLRRTFEGMSAYKIDTQITRVNVANGTATVQARVARRMTPRVGRAVANEVDAEFRLQRVGADWLIVGVNAR